MKRSVTRLMAVIFILIIFALQFAYSCSDAAGTFSLDDFSSFCSEPELSAEGFGGGHLIRSRADASAAAQALWDSRFDQAEVLHREVYYDSENDCWLISGMSIRVWCAGCSPFYGMTGGVHNIILSSDGRVLGIWSDM